MLESFTAATFEPRVGEDFTVAVAPGETLALRLSSCRSSANPGQPGARRPFSLYFHGPHARPLPQRMYPFSHPSLGDFDLFIVPVGRDPAGLIYEAVFN